MYLEAADRNKWLHRIATCLSEIHALEIETPPYTPWYDLNLLAPPPSTSRAQLWHRAIDIVRNELPVAELGFIHRDFQHFNLLWRHRTISGIVDWVFASTGPREIDVGHCRLNLALLFSADVAERFRLIYESESGRETDPRWDLAALIGYLTGRSHLVAQQAGRFAVVDQLGMNERIEETVRAAIARM